jgi:hypothetical protein
MTEKKDFTRTIIPAAAGWFVARLVPTDDVIRRDRLKHDAIVAWVVDILRDGGELLPVLTPLTYDYVSASKPHAIKRPDGLYEVPAHGVDLTADRVIAHLRDVMGMRKRRFEIWEEERERRAASPPPDPPPTETDTS